METDRAGHPMPPSDLCECVHAHVLYTGLTHKHQQKGRVGRRYSAVLQHGSKHKVSSMEKNKDARKAQVRFNVLRQGRGEMLGKR